MTDDRPLVLTCALLDDLDPLPYPERTRLLASRARRFAEDGVLQGVLEELEDGEPYERGLAVVAAAVARDRDWIAARLADPDPYVRGQALRHADSLGVPDSAYEQALVDAPAAVRAHVLRAVVGGRRTGLADRLIEPLRATWGDVEAARLLPGCSPETVRRLLPGLFASAACWSSLGRRHPGPYLDEAERQLAALPGSRHDQWWQGHGHDRGVAAAAPYLPHRVLDLLERHRPSRLPGALLSRLGPLVTADPGRFLGLFLGPDRLPFPRHGILGAGLSRRLARTAPADRLTALGHAVRDDSATLAGLLRALPPARRAAFHAEVTGDAGRTRPEHVDTALLDALPRSAVAAVARTAADRARSAGAPENTVLLAESYLPPDEVAERLRAATRRPAADDRALGWQALVGNAARSGRADAVASVLDALLALRNEQDPVRSAALRALRATPPGLFTDACAPLLDRIATDAVEARDSSAATRSALEALAVAVLRAHAVTGRRELVSWSLRVLVRISGSVGRVGLGRLDRTLRRGQEHQVFEALRTWMEAGAEKSDYGLALSLARSVGRRASAMPELQELLHQAVHYGDAAHARPAVELWLEPRAHRDERVALVLDRDRSAAALPAVWHVLATRRTDLLDGFLGRPLPLGRFVTRPGERTPAPGHDAVRWLPRQHRAALDGLADAAADERLPTHARVAAVAGLAALPGIGAGALRRWSRATGTELAEAALAALARTDRPADVLPDLLAHTGDDRARVAVYAFSRASRHVPPSKLATVLAERLAPGTGKVTSRKEMVRLAAVRLPAARAAALLAGAYTAEGQHRDVRAACVAFAVELPGEERAWEILADAAAGEPVLRAAVLRAHPVQLAEVHRPRFARLVREVGATDDPETAREAFPALAQWAPWDPEGVEVLVAAVTDLDRRGTWRQAAGALASAAFTGPAAAGALHRTLRTLAATDTADDAGAERDRPARQRFAALAALLHRHFAVRGGRGGAPDRQVVTGAAEVAAGYRDLVPHAVALLLAAVDLDGDPDDTHAELVRLAALHERRPALAGATAGGLGRRVDAAHRAGGAAPGPLLTVAARLTADGSVVQGLFGAALTVACGRRAGWPGEWRTQLRMVRHHAEPDVRDAGHAVATATE
ncbi:hypothetical protein [uncultured Streptomyces sp.]|uniref:hypothetical protein n=1 Tax=uncultured Streptomyces sp. TaxID=174707 RepID=UPI00262E9224|nr:hypothetical protein [uncultured Streptomyces sp.]